jgi:hypothetical protein
MTGQGVMGISDDWYSSTMGVIVISLGTCWSAGENFGCMWKCPQTNEDITNKLREIPWFILIFIRRTAGVISDSLNVHEQSIIVDFQF